MMHNPPHPGEILRADYPEPLELSVTEAVRALGVTLLATSNRDGAGAEGKEREDDEACL
jgi:hypothetical protein